MALCINHSIIHANGDRIGGAKVDSAQGVNDVLDLVPVLALVAVNLQVQLGLPVQGREY